MARTPSAATDSSSDAADIELAARMVVEDHWAVAALTISDRQRARALVKRAWRRGAPRLRDAWSARDTELLTRVADAYELAALEQADRLELAMRELDRAGLTPTLPTPPDDVTPPSDDGESAGAADAGGAPAPTLAGHATHTSSSHQAELAQVASALAALRGASDVAFTFVRTRPLAPPWDPAHLPHVLRALSIGALGADRVALRQWIAAARDARHETTGLAADDGTHQLLARWDARLRDTLVDVWLEIADHVLTGDESGDTDAVQRAFERLGEMREARATHEAQLLVTLSGDMVPVMRTYLQILYALADATAHTVVWARRGVTALAVPRARMALASAGTLTAGDRPLDTAYQWLTTALEVPMIVAGLPAPAGTLGERGSSVVEPDRHGAPARRRSRG